MFALPISRLPTQSPPVVLLPVHDLGTLLPVSCSSSNISMGKPVIILRTMLVASLMPINVNPFPSPSVKENLLALLRAKLEPFWLEAISKG